MSVGLQDTLHTGNTWKSQDRHWLPHGFEGNKSDCWALAAFKLRCRRNSPVPSCSIRSWSLLPFSCHRARHLVTELKHVLASQGGVWVALQRDTHRGVQRPQQSLIRLAGVTTTRATRHGVNCCESFHKPQLFPGSFSFLSSLALFLSLYLAA